MVVAPSDGEGGSEKLILKVPKAINPVRKKEEIQLFFRKQMENSAPLFLALDSLISRSSLSYWLSSTTDKP